MANFGDRERVEGIWNGKEVRFNREWSKHRFTDEEVQKLLAGESISFQAKSKAGNPYMAYGYLAEQSFVNSDGEEIDYVGFKLDFDNAPQTPPLSWCEHVFTRTELDHLAAGKVVHIQGAKSKRTGNVFDADVVWDDAEQTGTKRIRPLFD